SDPFIDKVTDFTQKHKDLLDRLCSYDNHSTQSTTNTCSVMDTSVMYGDFPPIEYQMMIDVLYRTERALQLMVPGQLVEGFVSKVSSNGLTIELMGLLSSSSSSLPALMALFKCLFIV
uniref:Uncharacterized protein n=1 Tax=Amphimedon queenslandica TaxID=400682 RepID=A0A1X7SDM4_AMPQE